MSEPRKCEYTLENGNQCGAFARSGKTLCFSHDPESHESKIAAVTRGGQAEEIKVFQQLVSIDIKNPQDVPKLIAQIISEVRSGALNPKIGSTLGFLAGQLLKAYEVANEIRRSDEIEKSFGIMPPKEFFGK